MRSNTAMRTPWIRPLALLPAAWLAVRGGSVARMPSKLRPHWVNITLTQPPLLGWRRPPLWNPWFDMVEREARP
jgi:hypothetical protein